MNATEPRLVVHAVAGGGAGDAVPGTDRSGAPAYVLPDLSLAGLSPRARGVAVLLQEVLHVSPAVAPQLAGWLRRHYVPEQRRLDRAGGPAPVSLISGARMSGDVVSTGHGPVEVLLTWRVSWTADGVRQGFEQAQTLRFAEAGADPGDDGRFVWRPVPDGVPGANVAAVDVGSTATTATLYVNTEKPGAAREAWDPRQTADVTRALAELVADGDDALRSAAAAALGTGDPGADLERALETLRATADVIGDHENPPANLVATLAALMPAVEAALEKRRPPQGTPDAPSSPDWLRWHRILAGAYELPLLFHNNLLPVDLAARPGARTAAGSRHRPEPVASRVVVRRTSGGADEAPADPRSPWPQFPYGLTLEDAARAGDPDDEYTFRNLKRSFSRPAKLSEPLPAVLQPVPPGPRPLDHGDVVAGVYAWIAHRCEQFGAAPAAGSPAGPVPRLDHLVVTYPASMPPTARRRLRRLLQHGLGLADVEMAVDEAVAAALYHVLREAADPDLGMSTFRARAQPVPNASTPAARQNLVVVDIGGGTLDIAVLATYLVDHGAPRPELTSGHRYVLRPQVIGSSGHPQLGGDLMTLKVYYWLKAIVADAALRRAESPDESGAGTGRAAAARELRTRRDALVEEDPRSRILLRRGLAESLLGHSAVEPAPAALRHVLRALVPTHWAGREGAGRTAFHRLWQTAEEAKIALGADEKYDVPGDLVLQMFPQGEAALLPLFAGEEAPFGTLDPADFARLVEPVVDQAADIALGAVARSLTDRPGQTLHRVVLSGRSSGMRLVEDVVRRRLRDARRRGVTVVGTPEISVERVHAKQATSIGAAWAAQTRLHTERRDEADLQLQGDNALRIDVDNLSLTAPCDFGLRVGGAANTVPLVTTGQRYAYTDVAGALAARSGWRGVVDEILVVRALGGGEELPWGKVRYDLMARDEGLTDEPSGFALRDPRVSFQLEVTQDLVPRVHLCCGPPVNVLPGDAVRLAADAVGDGAGTAAALHWYGDAEAATPGERSLLAVLLGEYGDLVVEEDGPLTGPVPAHLGTAPLPAPFAAEGERWWEVAAVAADGREGTRHRIPAPAAADRTAHYVVALDGGGVALVRGFPRYWAARGLHDMLEHRGSVLSLDMGEVEPLWRADWEPFTGEH